MSTPGSNNLQPQDDPTGPRLSEKVMGRSNSDANTLTGSGRRNSNSTLRVFANGVSNTLQAYKLPGNARPVDANEYFIGPRSFDRHSKWPMFMRLHGSILPKMIVPLLWIGGWASAITCIHELYKPIGLSNVLLTVLGFVVGLSLSFRNTTAYERYAEGRKYWQMLTQTSDTLARTIWTHVRVREEPEHKTKDLLNKVSLLNLVSAFSRSLMHKLRFEPYTNHEDLNGLVSHLDTFSRTATKTHLQDSESQIKYRNRMTTKVRDWADRYVGDYLGLQFASENPRKVLKEAKKPVGNLPLEILGYISTYIDFVICNDMLPVSSFQVHAANTLIGLHEILSGCERILNTPMPLAYCIAITQITWLYIMVLPFQLVEPLGWLAIPGTLVAGYIIIGLLVIGQEIENPFGNDVNDLPLEQFCSQICQNIKIIASQNIGRDPLSFMDRKENKVFHMFYTGSGDDSSPDGNSTVFYEYLKTTNPEYIHSAIKHAVSKTAASALDSPVHSSVPTPERRRTTGLDGAMME